MTPEQLLALMQWVNTRVNDASDSEARARADDMYEAFGFDTDPECPEERPRMKPEIKCDNCGTMRPAGQDYCHGCGDESEAVEETTQTARNGDIPETGDADTCPGCGCRRGQKHVTKYVGSLATCQSVQAQWDRADRAAGPATLADHSPEAWHAARWLLFGTRTGGAVPGVRGVVNRIFDNWQALKAIMEPAPAIDAPYTYPDDPWSLRAYKAGYQDAEKAAKVTSAPGQTVHNWRICACTSCKGYRTYLDSLPPVVGDTVKRCVSCGAQWPHGMTPGGVCPSCKAPYQ